jgi:thioredoxin-dependent peroxiredoxin
MLKIGDQAPNFLLATSKDQQISLKDFSNQQLVLYFYPKDDTPGCTLEAKEFNELLPEFLTIGCSVIGISRDSVESHNKFCTKHKLEITLASDSTGKVCQDYGVWVEKSMYGKKYMGINRSTFLIDKNAKIAYIWPKVSASGHAKQVLDTAAKG